MNDSAFMRKVFTDIIRSDDEFHVVGTARNAKEAIDKISELTPDVITLDVEMSIMDGLTSLKLITDQFKLPVVMLSSLTKEGTDLTLKALELGAVDFIAKPTNIFKINTEDMAKQITEKIKIASRITINSQVLSNNSNQVKKTKSISAFKEYSTSIKKIVAIGTSTGGPRALQEIIPFIPQNIPASFIIVQHMPEGFTKSLAERLNHLSQIHVKEAEHDEIIKPGYAYVAPGNYHLKLYKSNNYLKTNLTKENPVSGHRPSVDMMMNSLASLKLENIIGIILTGMGSDGAEGMKNIKAQNGYTIAQDENTCVVYGMPKAAVNLGCIDDILPIQDISAKIIKVVGV